MTKMKELYEKVANDSALQAKFNEIIKNAEKAGENATSEKLLHFATEAGFNITLDEVKDFFKEMGESKEGVLSDTELDMVAGGKSMRTVGGILCSVFTLGTGCAISSIMEEAMSKGGCGRSFQ